jgi:DHA3 family macrolide efflux protein-like MFS transporter
LTVTGSPVPPNWKRIIVLVWSGQAVSFVTSGAAGYALVWYLTVTTGSATVLALGTIAFFIPNALLGPFAGAIVDRHNRKHIMIAADLGVAAVTVLMALAIMAGLTSVPFVLVMIGLRSVGTTFHQPAMQAAMPLLVPERHLVRIGTLDQGLVGLANIAAPALGIVCYNTMGLQAPLFADAIGALVACGALLLVVIPDVHLGKSERTGVLNEMAAGLRAIRDCRGLTTFFVLSTVCTIAYMPMSAFFPLLTLQHFHGDGFAAAIVEGVFCFGFVIGSVILGVWGGGTRLVALVMLSVGACGAVVVAIGLLPPSGYWWFVVLSGLMAVVGAFYSSPMVALIQKNIEPQTLGRVMAVFGTLMSFSAPIGLVVGGPLADAIGVAPLFIGSGAVMVAVVVVALFFPVIHSLDQGRTPSPAVS